MYKFLVPLFYFVKTRASLARIVFYMLINNKLFCMILYLNRRVHVGRMREVT